MASLPENSIEANTMNTVDTLFVGDAMQPARPMEGTHPALLPCVRFDRTEEMHRYHREAPFRDELDKYPPGQAVARSPSGYPPNTVFIAADGTRYQGPDGQCSWPPNVPDLVAVEIYGNHGNGHRRKFDGLVNPTVEPLDGRGMYTERRAG